VPNGIEHGDPLDSPKIEVRNLVLAPLEGLVVAQVQLDFMRHSALGKAERRSERDKLLHLAMFGHQSAPMRREMNCWFGSEMVAGKISYLFHTDSILF
jgi:hypothetical protein